MSYKESLCHAGVGETIKRVSGYGKRPLFAVTITHETLTLLLLEWHCLDVIVGLKDDGMEHADERQSI